MSKVPGKVGFDQPSHGEGKTTTAKNKTKVGFTQPNHGTGKTSSKKNPSKVGFSQPSHGKGGTSTKKNPSKVGFDQPNRAGKTVSMPKYAGANVGKGAKVKKAGAVAPKFTSTDALVAYRKKKYGI